jgi:hypothetical protein
MYKDWRRYFFARSFGLAVVAGLLLAIVVWSQAREDGVMLSVDMRVRTNANGEVFPNFGGDYLPANRLTFEILPDGQFHRYSIEIRGRVPQALRVDPGSSSGDIEIRAIEVHGLGVNRFFSRATGLERSIRVEHQLKRLPDEGGAIRFESIGEDPYFDFPLADGIARHGRALALMITALAGCAGVLVFALLFAVINRYGPMLAQFPSDKSSSSSFVRRMACWLSDGRLVRTDRRFALFLCLAAVVFGLMVVGKFHFSSIGMWDAYVPQADKGSTELWGKPRAIRSDEWLVQTPFMLSQAQQGFPINNPSLGASGVPLVASVPVRSFIGYIQPRFWGFFSFDIEHGFSYLWAYRSVGLVVAFFVVFFILTQGNFWLALLGAVWVYLSSFNQWWFTTNLPDMLIAFAEIVVSAAFVLFGRTRRSIVLGGFGLVISAMSFVAALYPAFLIPLFWLGVFIFAGLFSISAYRRYFLEDAVFRAGVTVVACACVGIAIFAWLVEARDVLNLIMHSEYPGDRRNVLWATVPLLRIFTGFYDTFYTETQFPKALGNVCEASNFVMLFPIIGLVMLMRSFRGERPNGLAMALLLFCAVGTVWAVVGFPAWLATGTLMSMSPPERSFVGIGLGSIFLSITYVGASGHSRESVNAGWCVVLFLVGIALFSLLGASFHALAPDFYDLKKLMIIAVIGGLLVYALYARDSLALGFGVLFLVGPALTVNPLSRGMGAIYEKDIAREARELHIRDIHKRWLVIGGGVTSPQFFKAIGANVWNGVRFISTPDTFLALDPAEAYSKVWSRYAHVMIEPTSEMDNPVFELVQADVIRIRMNLCGGALKRMGITNVAFQGEPAGVSNDCLRLVTDRQINGFWLYSVK